MPFWLQKASPFGSVGPQALAAQLVNQPWDTFADQPLAANTPSKSPVPAPTSPRSSSAELIDSSYSNGPVLRYTPLAASTGFPTSAGTDDDPFTRAARRTRESVKPPGGRQEGLVMWLLQNYPPHVAEQLLSLPQRALEAAVRFQQTGELDPGPAIETALLTVGLPLTPKGALGSGARRPPRLPMDQAARTARADAMGFRRDMPVEFGTAPAGEKIGEAAFNVNGRVFTGRMHY
jgi:hypothetical protein